MEEELFVEEEIIFPETGILSVHQPLDSLYVLKLQLMVENTDPKLRYIKVYIYIYNIYL